jgi:hypothetical protein
LLNVLAGTAQHAHDFVFQFSMRVVFPNLLFDVHGFCPNLRSFYRLQENRESGWTTLCLLRPASSETEAAPSFRVFCERVGLSIAQVAAEKAL